MEAADFEEDIKNCTRVLQEGGIILYPTDTVWGLGCDATNAVAVQTIYTLKKRNDNKAMIVLVASEREVIQYTAGVDLSLFDYLDAASRPTTVIYDNAIGFADNLTAEDGSIAMRICKNDFCRALIKRFGKPIVSTSANISGEATPSHYKSISSDIKTKVDYIVRYMQNDNTQHQPSAIIKWVDGEAVIIR